jgi:hypothetical protein
MKLNRDDVKLYSKISKDLAEKLQPLIVAAVGASGLDRNLVQSALLKQLEVTPARIGVATAKRLLKNPKALVDGYQQAVAREDGQRQGNFDQNLRLMVARVAKGDPDATYRELKEKFPNCRSYKELQVAARLHVENGGRPLTVVRLSEKLYKNGGTPLPSQAAARRVDGNIVLVDGEALGFVRKDGGLAVQSGPCPKGELPKGVDYAHVDESSDRPQVDLALA